MEKRIEELLKQGLLHSEVGSAIYKEYAVLNLVEADRFKIACMVRDIDAKMNAKAEMTLTTYRDDGHAWIFVPYKTLIENDIDYLNLLSRFSYYDAKGVYAEGDCDAGKIIPKIDADVVFSVENEKYWTGLDCPVRKMQRIGG